MNRDSHNKLTFTINGEKLVFDEISPTMTLLDFLRNSGRVGTKEGCGDGDCGACTVALIGESPQGLPCFQAVNSCLIPLGAVSGREIVTVEGIGNGKPHPVQAAMIETGGSQCGYCTPGFIMSMFAAYYDGEITDAAIEGNLCRCTGYLPIRRAAQRLRKTKDRFSEKLKGINQKTDSFGFETSRQKFYRPTTLAEALDLLQKFPNAVLVAGATDLGLEFSWHTKDFPVLISTENVAELKILIQTDESVEIGAAVSLTHLEEKLKGVFPGLDEMLHWFAARQIKNRATIGGNIGTASPIGDLPPVFLSLDAELKLASAEGERTILLADFFKAYRQTDLRTGEIIVSVKIPKTISTDATRRLQQSYKVGKRGTDDISIVAAAYAIDLNREHQIVKARLAYGGVAAIPIRARAVEDWLVGKIWNLETVRKAKELLKDAFTPLTDVRGSDEYRKMLTANLFEKFFIEVTKL
ncbi:MAG: xanthine dehydrogenase small subunit [Acidobacteriota bacterium]|nr:xanthine dehydrogenase small subunit [Acidobacteriota bacterium]